MKQSFLLVLLFSFLSLGAYASEKLIFAVDVIRHGDRNPIYSAGKLKYDWPEGLEQLTALGKEQQKALGQKMRKRYVESKLLPAHYDAKTIFVRATTYQRTKDSAIALFSGLYPELASGDIVFADTLPNEQDPFTSEYREEEFKKAIQKNVTESKEYKLMTQKYQNKFKHWSECTGFPVVNLGDASRLGDITNIFRWKKIPLPQELTTKDLDQIAAIRTWYHLKKAAPPEVTHVAAIYAFREIVEKIERAAKKNSQDSLRWVLFSAHDAIIMLLQSIMQIKMTEIPPYASDLNFSLVEDDKNHRQYVKVFLNEKLLKTFTLDEFSALVSAQSKN